MSKIVQTYIVKPTTYETCTVEDSKIDASWYVIVEILWQHKATPELDLVHREVDSCCRYYLIECACSLCLSTTIQYNIVSVTCMYLAGGFSVKIWMSSSMCSHWKFLTWVTYHMGFLHLWKVMLTPEATDENSSSCHYKKQPGPNNSGLYIHEWIRNWMRIGYITWTYHQISWCSSKKDILKVEFEWIQYMFRGFWFKPRFLCWHQNHTEWKMVKPSHCKSKDHVSTYFRRRTHISTQSVYIWP